MMEHHLVARFIDLKSCVADMLYAVSVDAPGQFARRQSTNPTALAKGIVRRLMIMFDLRVKLESLDV